METGKYFKYAIGEIVIVVIGILITFQIITRVKIENTNLKRLYYKRN